MVNFLCDGSQAGGLTLTICLMAVLVLMIIIPMVKGRKQSQEYMNMLDNLKVGDIVETKGGVIGRITKLIDKGEIKTMIIETGIKNEKCFMEMDLQSVGVVLKSTKVEKTDEPEEKIEETDKKNEAENVDANQEEKNTEKKTTKQTEKKTKQTSKKSNKK